MTVVNAELCPMIVTTAPIPTPANRLLEVLLSRLFNLLCANRVRFSERIFIPIRNVPIPPRIIIIISTYCI